MNIFQQIKSWFSRKKEPNKKKTVTLNPYEVEQKGFPSKWAVDVHVDGVLKVTSWFNKKPNKRQLIKLAQSYQ